MAVVEARKALGIPTFAGSSLALLFWWQSLTPTLIPRTWEIQAAIGAVCLAIGYAIGTVAERFVNRLLSPLSTRSHADAIRRWGWIVLTTAWPIGVLFGAARWMEWQNEQRHFMGTTSIVWPDALLMGTLSPVAGVLLVVLGRVIVSGVAASYRFLHSCVPARVSAPAAVLLIVVLGIVLARGVALRAFTAIAHAVYAPVNEQTTAGITAPSSPSLSGSPASFIPWDTLGRMGRDFVATPTTTRELAIFHGADAELTEPVRVYVGIRSADSVAARADLAVRELARAGGFDRSVLVVWVPTGTGWMIPKAAAALEYLHRGDTAIVTIQYSFLPSLLAVFVDAGLANEAGIVLFDAVHARWSTLPREQRPKLVLFGKSLGTAGVEAPFAGADASSSVANMVARTDGALIVGAKQSNPIQSALTRERDPGSPVWQPVFDGGRSVRFLNRDPDRPALKADWPAPRIVYLQHPSDPVCFWNIDALWRRPEWMERPRGFDVPEGLRWFPIVSSVQAVGDFLFQLSPPPGFGHVYSTDYVNGWATVIPPDGWQASATERLERFIEKIAGDAFEP
jgi:uncharacterized membrane protein